MKGLSKGKRGCFGAPNILPRIPTVLIQQPAHRRHRRIEELYSPLAVRWQATVSPHNRKEGRLNKPQSPISLLRNLPVFEQHENFADRLAQPNRHQRQESNRK